jgi:hypothetical protein
VDTSLFKFVKLPGFWYIIAMRRHEARCTNEASFYEQVKANSRFIATAARADRGDPQAKIDAIRQLKELEKAAGIDHSSANTAGTPPDSG